jgi:hypothetical protein
MEIIDAGGLSGHQNDPEKIARDGYPFRMGEYLNFAFAVLQKDPLKFFAYGFISAVIAGVPFLVYPAYAGFFIVADKIKKGEPYVFEDFFGGFKDKIGPLIIASIVAQLLIFVGLLLCILPGIYLAIAWSFAIPFVLFYTGDFWQALELSRKVITKNWFGFFALVLVAALLSGLGVILCFVGIFLTLPIFYLSIYAAYEDVVGTGK